MSAPTHRIVNGEVVQFSPAEAAAVQAAWDANPPPTAAQTLVAHRQSAVDALPITSSREVMLLRALVIALVDELNLHAAKINAILTAIDAGANLAAVKVNIAAIADYPARTAAQVRTALLGKVTAGDADT